MSFPTNNYFLSGWVSPHISCFFLVQKEFSVIETLSRDGTLEKVLECSQQTSFYRTCPVAADSCSV